MTADLKIVEADFNDAIRSITSIKSAFDSMQHDDGVLADSVGHSGLPSAVRSFCDSWRVKRQDLVDSLEKHKKDLEQVRDTWTDVDNKLAPNDDGKGKQPKQDPPCQEPPTQPSAPSSPGSPGGGASGGGRNWFTGDYNASPVGGGSSSEGGISDPRTEPAKDPGAVAGTAGPTATINPTDVVDPGQTPEVTDTTANPDLDPTKYPEVAKLKELLGQAVDVVLESHPDGGVTLRVGSVSGLSLIALTALMARRGKAEAGDGAVNAADAETGAAGALRKALGLVTGTGKTAPGAVEGAPHGQVQAALTGSDSQPDRDGASEVGADRGRASGIVSSAEGSDGAEGGREVGGSDAQDILRKVLGADASGDAGAGQGGASPGSGAADLSATAALRTALGQGVSDGDGVGGLDVGSGGSLPGSADNPLIPNPTDGMVDPSSDDGTTASDGSTDTTTTSTEGTSSTEERRDSSMMYGGMGMAAGIGASAGQSATRQDEERASLARRLRERLAAGMKKEEGN